VIGSFPGRPPNAVRRGAESRRSRASPDYELTELNRSNRGVHIAGRPANAADQLYSEKEAARIWGVAPRTLRAWRKAQLIECTHTPTGRIRYTLDQILAGKAKPR